MCPRFAALICASSLFAAFSSASPAAAADEQARTPLSTGIVAIAADLAITAPAPDIIVVAPAAPDREPQRATGRRIFLSALEASYAGLQVYDVYSTMTTLRRGGYEANPFMSDVTSSPTAFIATKAGLTAVTFLAAERLWKQHHRTAAIVVMAVSNGIMSAVAANNAAVLRQLR